MRNILFPTTIIDGFFENPESVRDFALQQNFYEGEFNYPGKRTKQLYGINELFFNTVANKFLNIFYSREKDMNWNASMHFQLIDESYESGWIHRDNPPAIATGIVYLTKDEKSMIGTSLYDKKNIVNDPGLPTSEIRNNSFKSKIPATEERIKCNDEYKEVLRVEGLFNRAFFFDSHLYHSAQNFVGQNKEDSRLTLIIFFHKISSEELFPIQRSHCGAITLL